MDKTPKKKILYVITKSNFGGAQRYVHELAVTMKNSGYSVTVAYGGGGILKDKLEANGINTREIKSFQRDINLYKELRSFTELYKLYKSEKADIVHLNSSKAGGSGALMARIAGVKEIIYTAHGWPFLEPRNLLWKSLAWTGSFLTTLLSHKVILVSEHDYMHTTMPFVTSKLYVIHTAVSEISFKERGDARLFLLRREIIARHLNDFWLITSAELNHNKNLFAAIDAVIEHNKTHDQKIYYSIMGDGELKEELVAYIEKYQARDFVTLLGYVDNGRIYLKAFDAFLLPSKKEGMPYALIEAGAAGLPSIASDVGGIPEIIKHEKNGLLIDPYDVSTIVSAIATLVEDSDLQNQLGTSLKKKVEEKFLLHTMVSKTKKVYGIT